MTGPMSGLRRDGTTVGLISDTHGLVRPEALAALRGVDRIVHAGDIGSLAVLTALEAIAPVTAIRGNIDRDPWAGDLPETAWVELAGHTLYVLHDVKALDLDPAAAGVDVVIAGHSHQPRIAKNNGVLYVNPGSAGPRRFRLPICVARLRLRASGPSARIVELSIP